MGGGTEMERNIMSLFGSAKSAKIADIEVALASASAEGTTLLVNGVAFGTVRKGKTRAEDTILVNSALSEHHKAEALVGLMAVLSGDSPERICKLLINFRKHNPELPGVKGEIDRLLKRKGLGGFSAIASCIKKAVREGRVRKGPLETCSCTIHEGIWLLNERVNADRKESTKSLTWLACMELGMPRDVCERLMDEMNGELEGDQ